MLIYIHIARLLIQCYPVFSARINLSSQEKQTHKKVEYIAILHNAHQREWVGPQGLFRTPFLAAH